MDDKRVLTLLSRRVKKHISAVSTVTLVLKDEPFAFSFLFLYWTLSQILMASGTLLRQMQHQHFVLLCLVTQGSWCLSLYRYKSLVIMLPLIYGFCPFLAMIFKLRTYRMFVFLTPNVLALSISEKIYPSPDCSEFRGNLGLEEYTTNALTIYCFAQFIQTTSSSTIHTYKL